MGVLEHICPHCGKYMGINFIDQIFCTYGCQFAEEKGEKIPEHIKAENYTKSKEEAQKRLRRRFEKK